MDNKIIYLDSASKTIPYEECFEVFNNAQKQYFANPSSIHFEGVKALRYIDGCREEILNALSLSNKNILFTSSATEANNLALKGFAFKYKNRGKHIISTSYEHESVKEALKQLEEEFGFEVTYLKPNSEGVISVSDVISQIRKDTILVSIMAVNNEIGSINDIDAIGKELKKYPKICFHVDAAQAIGKIKMDFNQVDLLTISGHKIHGFVGSAALIFKKNLVVLPMFSGGGQEFGLRSSTLDIANISVLTYALKTSIKEGKNHFDSVSKLSTLLYEYLSKHPEKYHINSNNKNPYIVNFSTISKKGSVVVEALSRNGIMVSSTSACSSYKEKGSYVVESINSDPNVFNNTIRVSFSYLNTVSEIETFIKTLDKIVEEIR
ncbi:MAG: cysteine desulfurase [Bacilli bacterium]|nr:cysteine desulfurase [Bacilli bacterium]